MTANNKTFLKIAAEHWVPWCSLHEAQNGSITITGPVANILHIMAKQMDFEYELIRPPDRLWGSELSNGSWNGMIGMLQREEVEIAMGPFTVTQQRESVIDMSMPVAFANKALLMQRPTIQSDVAGFLKTFAPEVWLAILVSMVAVSTAMSGITKMEDDIFMSHTKNYVSTSITWMMQTLSQETSVWLPKKDGSRVLVTTWLLASLVFMSSYSGILTAMLTVPRVTIPIDSLEDLVAQSDMPWKLEIGSSMFLYFQEATDALRRRVFEERGGTFRDCWTDRQDIVDGEFVAICDDITMMKAMSWDFSTTGRCHLYKSRENVYTSSFAVSFKAGSEYLSQANQVILALKGSGILDKWLNDQFTNTSLCLRPPSKDRGEGIAPLSFEAFTGPLLVLAGGFSLSTLTLLLEVVIGYCAESTTTS